MVTPLFVGAKPFWMQQQIQVDLAAENQGIRAVFWSDPCFSSKWITCVPREKEGVGRAISDTKSVARVSFARKTETSESQLGCAKMAFFLVWRPNSCVLPYSVDKHYVISVSSSSWSSWWWWWWWWWSPSPSPSPPSSKQPSSRFSPIS